MEKLETYYIGLDELEASMMDEIERLRAELAKVNQARETEIGPDAKPRSWQITDERFRAIQMGLDYLEWAYAKSGREDIHEHAGQLRAMLGEAGQ